MPREIKSVIYHVENYTDEMQDITASELLGKKRNILFFFF